MKIPTWINLDKEILKKLNKESKNIERSKSWIIRKILEDRYANRNS